MNVPILPAHVSSDYQSRSVVAEKNKTRDTHDSNQAMIKVVNQGRKSWWGSGDISPHFLDRGGCVYNYPPTFCKVHDN